VRTELLRPAVPAEAQRRCAEPVALPGRRLTEREVTSLWGRDRSALRTCEERRAAAVGAAVSLGAMETGGAIGGAAGQGR
jgi:hypothetical protein